MSRNVDQPLYKATHMYIQKKYGAEKTNCKNGHEFTVDNIYILSTRPTVRNCKRCQADAQRRYIERRRNV